MPTDRFPDSSPRHTDVNAAAAAAASSNGDDAATSGNEQDDDVLVEDEIDTPESQTLEGGQQAGGQQISGSAPTELNQPPRHHSGRDNQEEGHVQERHGSILSPSSSSRSYNPSTSTTICTAPSTLAASTEESSRPFVTRSSAANRSTQEAPVGSGSTATGHGSVAAAPAATTTAAHAPGITSAGSTVVFTSLSSALYLHQESSVQQAAAAVFAARQHAATTGEHLPTSPRNDFTSRGGEVVGQEAAMVNHFEAAPPAVQQQPQDQQFRSTSLSAQHSAELRQVLGSVLNDAVALISTSDLARTVEPRANLPEAVNQGQQEGGHHARITTATGRVLGGELRTTAGGATSSNMYRPTILSRQQQREENARRAAGRDTSASSNTRSTIQRSGGGRNEHQGTDTESGVGQNSRATNVDRRNRRRLNPQNPSLESYLPPSFRQQAPDDADQDARNAGHGPAGSPSSSSPPSPEHEPPQ